MTDALRFGYLQLVALSLIDDAIYVASRKAVVKEAGWTMSALSVHCCCCDPEVSQCALIEPPQLSRRASKGPDWQLGAKANNFTSALADERRHG